MSRTGVVRFEQVLPEPASFWICHSPAPWPGPSGWWIDLARGRPASTAMRHDRVPELDEVSFDDVVYIPPLESAAEVLRQELLQRCSETGVPALQQILPGDSVPAGAGEVVIDLTESLLKQRVESRSLPPGVWVLWTLIPGLTDAPEFVAETVETLVVAGVRGVAPIAPALSPTDRRALAALGSVSSYLGVFHGDEKEAVTALTRAVSARGLDVIPDRPPLPDRRQRNRSLAAHFATLAELWLRNGRAEGRAQEFFRVSRRLEEEPVDVGELARRGGLAAIEWLDDRCSDELLHVVGGEPSELMQELEEELSKPELDG